MVVFPLVARETRDRAKRRWAASLLRSLGVTLRVSGAPVSAPMLLANHVSWLDAVALTAIAPAAFVAKHELRRWPLAGTVIARAGNIFIQRRRPRDVLRVNAELELRMRQGDRVAVFPEGTTTDGRGVAPFRNALLQSSIRRGTPVQPVAIAFRDAAGRPAPHAAYHGDISFGASLLAIAASPGVSAHLRVAPPVDTRGRCRRATGALARARILDLLEKAGGQREPATAPERPGMKVAAFGAPVGGGAFKELADLPEP